MCGRTLCRSPQYNHAQRHSFDEFWARYRYVLQIFVEKQGSPNIAVCYSPNLLKWQSFCDKQIRSLLGLLIFSMEIVERRESYVNY